MSKQSLLFFPSVISVTNENDSSILQTIKSTECEDYEKGILFPQC